MPITVGCKGRAETTVTQENTAAAVGSGLVPVFATPYMIALMENAAVNALAPCMAEGEGTVGTRLEVTHDAATPVGMKVWCESRLVQADGRRMVFQAEVFDECGKIGEGEHERFLVRAERFQQKADAKGNLQQGKEQEITG